MGIALALAEQAAQNGDVPVGAVVVRGDDAIGRGFNRREADLDPTAHAEILAVREAARALGSWRLEGCRIYVTLEPCAMCAGALVLSRIDRCLFGCTDPKGGWCGTVGDLSAHSALNHRFQVVSGVLEAECRDQLQEFFRGLRMQKRTRRSPPRPIDGGSE